ncbi:uncharacterized protein METZ01_LOCUS193601 [marine metagenome]|uniref:Uncharacterized protein n=1 Tax=marine metagenome TaxID=408172 RepID=A0A382DT44_9ZZZZ
MHLIILQENFSDDIVRNEKMCY